MASTMPLLDRVIFDTVGEAEEGRAVMLVRSGSRLPLTPAR